MIKYALRIYDSYIPLIRDSGTLEQAIEAALEVFDAGEVANFDRDLDFEIIEIARVHKYNTGNYNDFFEKRAAEWTKLQKERQDRLDREAFERLKKKFDKCVCREKELNKNCPTHGEFSS